MRKSKGKPVWCAGLASPLRLGIPQSAKSSVVFRSRSGARYLLARASLLRISGAVLPCCRGSSFLQFSDVYRARRRVLRLSDWKCVVGGIQRFASHTYLEWLHLGSVGCLRLLLSNAVSVSQRSVFENCPDAA